MWAFALAAHAEVGNPTAAYQSAFKIAMAGQPIPAEQKSAPQPVKPAPVGTQARGEPVATPVPEQFVSEGPASLASRRAVPVNNDSAVSRMVSGAEKQYKDIESFLGRVASTGQGSSGPGAGVPVLVLAFLCTAAVLDHYRRHGRWATDEDTLELLYARELTPPG